MSTTRGLEGELKQQGAVEAAQDPNSSITAADAQAKIVHESRRAGVSAFSFDPDASPEEKAAQARAVSYLSLQFSSIRSYKTLCSMSPKGFIMSTNPKVSRSLQILMMVHRELTTYHPPLLLAHSQLPQKTANNRASQQQPDT